VASYDEDTTSMGVEAARAPCAGPRRLAPAASTSRPPTRPISTDQRHRHHAVLALDDRPWPSTCLARSARPRALRAAADAGAADAGRAVGHPDRPLGRGGRARRRRRGGAFLMASGDGETPVLAERSPRRSVTADSSSAGGCRVIRLRQWEERFGEHAYGPLAEAAMPAR